MVALYFAIEDESKDDKPCTIFIFDKSMDICLDSLEMKILLMLTVKEISSLDELQHEVASKLGIECNKNQLKQIITSNYIINYDIELSYSNKRALLQGGTGLYFGFGINENNIFRKGNLNINSLCAKITIPYKQKTKIREYLKKYGISKAVLYDNANKSSKKLKYKVIKTNVERKSTFNKIILDIIVSDVVFVKEDILNIVLEVFKECKRQYESDARIFMYVYYDEEDIRSYNWIAQPTPINDFKEFQLNFNYNYHTKRMTYFNEEISINTIYTTTEPIVKKCKQGLINIIEAHHNYFSGKISRNDYKYLLQQVIKSLHKIIYFDLQDISHGSGAFDAYYQSSNNFCMDVIAIAEDQVIYINRNDNDASIQYNYNIKKQYCDNSLKKYIEAYKSIRIIK